MKKQFDSLPRETSLKDLLRSASSTGFCLFFSLRARGIERLGQGGSKKVQTRAIYFTIVRAPGDKTVLKWRGLWGLVYALLDPHVGLFNVG